MISPEKNPKMLSTEWLLKLAEEDFLKKEKGALQRYNDQRKMHVLAEVMPEKEIIEEKWN